MSDDSALMVVEGQVSPPIQVDEDGNEFVTIEKNRIPLIDGVPDRYVRNKHGEPIFLNDGSPLKPGRAPQCTRITSSSGWKDRCHRTAVASFDYPVCQVHGAGSPHQGRPGGRPPKWGGYRLPKDLQQRFEDTISDPDILSLTREIAIFKYKLQEDFAILFSEEYRIARETLYEAARTIKRAENIQDPGARSKIIVGAVEQINEAFDTVILSDDLWGEFIGVTSQLSRLTEKEVARRKVLNNFVAAERVMDLLDQLVLDFREVIVDFVDDPKKQRQAREALNARIARRVGAVGQVHKQEIPV